MDDIIDTMLDNHRSCSRYGVDLYGETCGSFESIRLIGDAIILAEDTGAAYSPTNDCYMLAIFFHCTNAEVVRPRLSRDAITKTDKRIIISLSKDIDGV